MATRQIFLKKSHMVSGICRLHVQKKEQVVKRYSDRRLKGAKLHL